MRLYNAKLLEVTKREKGSSAESPFMARRLGIPPRYCGSLWARYSLYKVGFMPIRVEPRITDMFEFVRPLLRAWGGHFYIIRKA